MKKYLKYFIATAALLALVGCGGGGSTPSGGGSGGGTSSGVSYLKVVNASSSTSHICHIYSNPTTSSTWGPDRLTGTIPPGYYKKFVTHACNREYALRVVFCDSHVAQIRYYRPCGATKAFVFRNW